MTRWIGAAGFGKGTPMLAAALILAGFFTGSLVASMGGCITINIYFPAAAAEKAADRIIDDVLGSGKSGAEAPPAPAAPAR